jgi:predicted MPP superfamily phosphohydrolase
MPAHLHSFLDSLHLATAPASILLSHVPHRLPIVERAGVSLQLSGHTHGGQFFPFTRIVSRIYGHYVHGLQRFGNLMVYVTWGAGTWGPPMRVGTKPEIVLLHFE